MQTIADLWDKRYQQSEYLYGTQANDFVRQQACSLSGQKILCVAEGEGRNAVYLAKLGYQVTAVDISKAGIEKTLKLAKANHVEVTAIQADLAQWSWPQEAYDGVIAIFAHFPVSVRAGIHQAMAQSLVAGGTLILEAYTPEQLAYQSGGPPKAEMMMNRQSLLAEFPTLTFHQLDETVREVHEGKGHHGLAAVVQAVATKP